MAYSLFGREYRVRGSEDRKPAMFILESTNIVDERSIAKIARKKEKRGNEIKTRVQINFQIEKSVGIKFSKRSARERIAITGRVCSSRGSLGKKVCSVTH